MFQIYCIAKTKSWKLVFSFKIGKYFTPDLLSTKFMGNLLTYMDDNSREAYKYLKSRDGHPVDWQKLFRILQLLACNFSTLPLLLLLQILRCLNRDLHTLCTRIHIYLLFAYRSYTQHLIFPRHLESLILYKDNLTAASYLLNVMLAVKYSG